MNKVFSIGGKCDTTCEYSGKCNTTCEYIYFSIYNIAATIGNVCEVIIFAFVVYSQISFTGEQKGRRDALRNVLLCGKATIEDLERAILEQNADLPEDELAEIRVQLTDFKSFYYDTESSQSLIANLVEERPGFEYGNYNFKLRRSVFEANDEPHAESFYQRPSLIGSVQGPEDESMQSERQSLFLSVESLSEFIDLN